MGSGVAERGAPDESRRRRVCISVKEGLSKEDANKFAELLKAAGATVELK